MSAFDRTNNPKATTNPKPNVVSTAYGEARDVLGDTPKTPRETLLFEALQHALQEKLDKSETEELKDVRDELQKTEDALEESEDRAEAEENRADEGWERIEKLRKGLPPKASDIDAARDLVRHLRRHEPQGATAHSVVSGIRAQYEHREMVTLIDDLVRETEAWRKLFESLTEVLR